MHLVGSDVNWGQTRSPQGTTPNRDCNIVRLHIRSDHGDRSADKLAFTVGGEDHLARGCPNAATTAARSALLAQAPYWEVGRNALPPLHLSLDSSKTKINIATKLCIPTL